MMIQRMSKSQFFISMLELVPFHKDGEEEISVEEMYRRFADTENFPDCRKGIKEDAKQLLELSSEFPASWAREGLKILFPCEHCVDIPTRNDGIAFLEYVQGSWKLSPHPTAIWRVSLDRRFRFIRYHR